MTLDLNYNHLHYFWHVAREGSVVAAARELLVSQPAISSQLRDLERSLKVKLFERSGRGLKLTDAGRMVYRYADEMFMAGQNLVRALGKPGMAAELRLVVGVADAVPKELVCRMLSPALGLRERVRVICREDKADRLLADLAANRLDLVLADTPLGAGIWFAERIISSSNAGRRSWERRRWRSGLEKGSRSRWTGARFCCPPM